jgi:membrane-bound lytic murein transglycosylase A
LAREALTSVSIVLWKFLQQGLRAGIRNFRSKNGGRYIAAAAAIAVSLSLAPLPSADGRHNQHLLPYPKFALPLTISGSQYVPVLWTDVPGWDDDDHLAAFQTFRTSCKAISSQSDGGAEPRALGMSLREPCRAAKRADISDNAKAGAFFQEYFRPLQISRLGEDAGFVTGYYEPVLEGSRTRTDVYNVPVYRRPSNLFVRGYTQDSPELPNKGDVFRKIGRRKLVPYYDRAQIEDGAIAGRGLEICWLKSQTDLLFAQIQGSARIRLQDGSTIRMNYAAHNGYPYTPVGRVLIDRGIIPKDQMSMQKIRDWMEQNPDAANEVRRQNRSYIFFREVPLSDKDEAVGAQGVPLTPGRSIAVDKSLHVYGTPFFIEGKLPIESEQAKTPFHRLMIAQDTGSAITGPARADLYFGAGADAGKVSGRLKNNANFIMLVPKSLDPVALGRRMPLPDPRPSARIARLYPQVDPLKEQPGDQNKDQKSKAAPTSAQPSSSAPSAPQVSVPKVPAPQAPAPQLSVSQDDATAAIPLPQARPDQAPGQRRHGRHHRGNP